MLARGRPFECRVLRAWYDTGNVPAYAAACKAFPAKFDVLFKKDESICFLGDRVIKFFADPQKLADRVSRGRSLVRTARRRGAARACAARLGAVQGREGRVWGHPGGEGVIRGGAGRLRRAAP